MTGCLLQTFDFALNYYLGAQSLGWAQEIQTDKAILVIVACNQMTKHSKLGVGRLFIP